MSERTLWKQSLIGDDDVLNVSVVCWGGNGARACVLVEVEGDSDAGLNLSPVYEQEFLALLREAFAVARKAREEA